MNEEIAVTFGANLNPLAAGMKGIPGMVKGVADSVKSGFRDAMADVGRIIAGGELMHGITGVLDKFEELSDRAQNLEISTDFLQGMEHIASKDAVGGVETFNKAIGELSVKLGDAKGGSEEAIKKFQKWGISLKDIAESDAEEMFYKISDRIKSIPDPAERGAAAFDLMGKAGKNLAGILSNGADELHRMVDGVDKLDSEKIKQLAEAKSTISDVTNTATIYAGKAVGAIADLGSFLGKFSVNGPSALLSDFDAKPAEGKAKESDTSLLKQQADAILSAKEKYLIAVGKSGNDESKLLAMYRERRDLQDQVNGMQGDSVEKYKLLTEIAGKDKEIQEQIAKMKKESDDKRKKADEEKEKKLKEEKELTADIAKTREKIQKEKADIRREQMSEYMPTLEDLAKSGYWSGRGRHAQFNEGPFAAMAQELLDLKQRAKEDLMFGDKNAFNQDKNRIDQLKSALAAAGVQSPDDRLESMDASLKDSKDHLKELLQQAKTVGLKVIGPED